MDVLSNYLPFLILVIILFFVSIVRNLFKKPDSTYGYQQRDALFTQAEINFLQALNAAVGEQYEIFGKVRVADVLSPQKGLNRSHWQTAFNRIAMKHFDFVLCAPETLEVKYVIELDDKSHKKGKTQKRDAFLNDACQQAGLTLMRVQAKSLYELETFNSLLKNK